MTGTYEWNPMPHVVEIRCPECSAGAFFEFAEVVRIALKKDVEFFKNSKLFDYKFLPDSVGGHWHAAFYFPRLHGCSTDAIRDLPAGYSPSDWSHSQYLYRSHGSDFGTAHCTSCGLRRRHVLDWPSEARYQVEFRGSVLWAFDRESATEIRDFVASADRNRATFRWQRLLLHIPKEFLVAKARDELVKRLDKCLASDGGDRITSR
jgi:hypothetical protein